MNIESLKQATPAQRAPAPNAAPPTTRREVSQVGMSGSNAVEIQSQSIDEKSREGNATLSVEDAVKRISDFVAPTQSEISFSVDQVSGVQVVKIMDSQSNEVIRQFPSKEAIEIARALDKLQGLLIKDKA